MSPWYTTRERVKSALDIRATARMDARVDAAIAAASRFLDGEAPGGGCLHRRFYPEAATRYFDLPSPQYAEPYRLWLDQHEVVSVASLTVADVPVSAADYLLRPDHGPPFSYIEMNLATSSAFSSATSQRAVALTAIYCGCALVEAPAGTLAEDLDGSETAVDVSNSAAVGVGTIIRVDSERMIVTGKSSLDTGQNLVGTIAADMSVAIVPVASGAALNVGEVILLDAERMEIIDIAGNNVIVKRAVDGSALTAHTNSDVYAPRTLTVQRGALGTTAATHSSATAAAAHVVPGPIDDLTVAEALNLLLGHGSGWARTIGAGDNEREYGGKGLTMLRKEVAATYARRARKGAI